MRPFLDSLDSRQTEEWRRGREKCKIVTSDKSRITPEDIPRPIYQATVAATLSLSNSARRLRLEEDSLSLGTPMGSGGDDRWTRELSKIEIVKESMASCQALTDSMMEILQSFEDKLQTLDHTVQPILEYENYIQTETLTTRQVNIEMTITKVDELIFNVQLANTSPHEIPSIEADYKAYLGWLKNVHMGVQYFKANSKFRKGSEALHKLKELLEDGVKECMREFFRRLSDSVTQPYRAKDLLRAHHWRRLRNRYREHGEGEDDGAADQGQEMECQSSVGGLSAIGGNFLKLGGGGRGEADASAFSMAEGVPGDRKHGDGEDEKDGDEFDVLDMINKGLVVKMGSIASFLFLNSQTEYLDKLVSERSSFVSDFLTQTIEKKETNPLFSGSNKKGGGQQQAVLQQPAEAERYARGSHQAIFLLHLTMQIVILESQFPNMLLKDNGNLPHSLYSEYVGRIMEVPVDYLIKKWAKTAKDLSHSNPLVLLDMLGEYNSVHRDFMSALRNSEEGGGGTDNAAAYTKMMGLQKTISKACGRSFHEYETRILKQKEKIKSHGAASASSYGYSKKRGGQKKRLPSDGTVWQGTVKCFSFLVNGLLPYREVLEHPCLRRCSELKEFLRVPKKRKSVSIVGSVILTIIDTLKSTLVEISKRYRNPSLSQIFLLNNYHFISKRIREVGELQSDLKEAGFEKEYSNLMKDAQELYLKYSWDKALQHISVDDSKKILDRCTEQGNKRIPDWWAKSMIKSKFREFNDKFAKQYEDQNIWSVPDADLRSQIRNLNLKKIWDDYKKFYE
eukprot:jgi/Bigna1/80532/fgenesh1_pg.72_\